MNKTNINYGHLTIYFSYVNHYSSTEAMLNDIAKKYITDKSILIGYLNPSLNSTITNIVKTIPKLIPSNIYYKNETLKEFNLDEALKLHPSIIVIDEIAHTNVPTVRHPKRYSDIKELLKNGIDVYTTLNVQQLESLNDVVASLVKEKIIDTIPDKVFDRCDKVKYIDIDPQIILNNYPNEYTYESLSQLREIALRRCADILNIEHHDINKNELVLKEHILICLSSSPSNAKVIRTAARLVKVFHADFTALYVETPNHKDIDETEQLMYKRNCKLAQNLGARVVTVYGDDVAYQISSYVKISGITKIIIGRTNANNGHIFKKSNLVDTLSKLVPNLDVYIIPENLPPYKMKSSTYTNNIQRYNMITTAIIISIATIISLILFQIFKLESLNLMLIYVISILILSTRITNKKYILFASIINLIIFDLLFIEPLYSFLIYDSKYIISLIIMFITSLVTSNLTSKSSEQIKISTMKSSRTEILLETSQKLQKAKNKEEIYLETNLQLNRLLDKVIIFYPVEDNHLKDPLITGNNDYDISKLFEKDLEIVDWVYRNNQSAGISTNTFSNAHALYLSIRSANKCFGVVGIAMNEYEELPIFERSLLSAMLNEIALALDKFYLNEARELMKMEAEKERLRANLLRSISHDLRTPLTSISGNANILLDTSEKLDRSTKKALYKDIYEDSLWLINLVENLLAVTRIENGSIAIRLVPELIEEVVVEALNHCRKHQGEHNIVIDNQAEFIMAKLDTRLIIQVIVNLVDNAVKYTNGNSTIIIKEYVLNDYIHVEVIDEGVGIKDSEKENIFKMFYTVNNSIGDARRGLGLGLSLCKSIIDAHGGIIYIKDNKPTGSIIGFTLKKEEVNINERNDTCS